MHRKTTHQQVKYIRLPLMCPIAPGSQTSPHLSCIYVTRHRTSQVDRIYVRFTTIYYIYIYINLALRHTQTHDEKSPNLQIIIRLSSLPPLFVFFFVYMYRYPRNPIHHAKRLFEWARIYTKFYDDGFINGNWNCAPRLWFVRVVTPSAPMCFVLGNI